jgi:hypothetical protein
MSTDDVPIGGSQNRGWFFAATAVLLGALVILGFSRSYYFKLWFDRPPLSPRLHIHGVVLSAWLALYVAQTLLIPVGRRQWHRQLGVIAGIIAGIAVVTTYAAAFESGTSGLAGSRALPALEGLYSSLLLATLFGIAVAAGLWHRNRPAAHKRLMFLAVLAAMSPGANRAAALMFGHGISGFHVYLIAVLLVAALMYDVHTRGRPHVVIVWGGAVLLVLELTRRVVGRSDAWMQFASWLTS